MLLDIVQYSILHPLVSTKAFLIKFLNSFEELVENFLTSQVIVL